MHIAIALAVDRLQRSRAARDAREAEQWPLAGHGHASTNRALEVGARVFDLVTGQEGEVIYGTRENFVVPAPQRRDG
jgi:hypothetical protein